MINLWKFSICICSLLIFHFYFVDAALSDYIHEVCKRSDPNINTCVKNSIDNLRDKLATGIPELNVPGMEPLHIPRLELHHNVNVNFSDVYIQGPSTFELVDINVDIKKHRFAFLYKFKELKFHGKYDIDMQILRIPLKSSGPMHGYFKNCKLTGKMQGKKKKINDKFHMVFLPIELKLYQEETRLRMENLFNGNKVMQDAANDLLDRNKDILNDAVPALEKTLSEHFTLIANQITSHFTYDELFPLN